jgi:putative ABC transport system permease protein
VQFESLGQDVRTGLRHFARRPGFTVAALITLALGIGAPTAIFSVVHAVLLRPLPYPQAERLIQFRMSSQSPAGPISFTALPASMALDWARESQALDSLALFNDRALTLETPEGPFRLSGVSATPNLFAILGTVAAAGHTFAADTTDLREIVLSHATWSRFFRADTAIAGRTITLDGASYTVTGVMPAGFAFPTPDAAFWVPQPLSTDGTRGMLLPAVARLRAGATIAAVVTEGQQRISQEDGPFNATLTVETLHDQMVGVVRRLLWILAGAVAFLTLVATVTLALLLVTRGADRAREFTIRTALGAGRARLIRQLCVESLTLGIAGGLAGLALAALGIRALVSLAPADMPRLQQVGLHPDVLLFALVLTIGTSLIFGVLAAARTLAIDPRQAMSGAGQRLELHARPMRRRLAVLAAAQLAMTLVLVVGAGLLARSFVRLVSADQGFDAGTALALQINLPASRYPTPAARLAQQQLLLDAVRRTPGVDIAGLTTTLPMRQPTGRFGFSASPEILGIDEPFSMPVIDVHMVSGGFMEAMGLRVTAGRTIGMDDRDGSEPVIVISDQFAREQFGARPAVGQLLYSRSGNRRVVGVVEDVRTAEAGGLKAADAYLPLSQNPDVLQWFSTATVLLRGSASASALRPAVLSVDPQSPPYNVRPLSADASRVVAGPRFSAAVLSMFGLVAMVMATAGVYGVMAYAARLRTREIGVRLAVGASRGEIMRLMLRGSAVTIASGLAAGAAAALLLARTLTGLLHDVTPADGWTVAASATILGAAGLAASWLPARRAMRLDPLRALRDE